MAKRGLLRTGLAVVAAVAAIKRRRLLVLTPETEVREVSPAEAAEGAALPKTTQGPPAWAAMAETDWPS